jgi:hypothetical protein
MLLALIGLVMGALSQPAHGADTTSVASTDAKPAPAWLAAPSLLLERGPPFVPDSELEPAGPAELESGLRGLPPDAVETTRLGLVVGGLAAGNMAAYLYQRHLWWGRDHLGGFRFHDDGGYSEHIDKVSHAYATYVQGMVIARSLRWSGVSPEASALWGGVAAWLVQLNVEIRDGFSEAWGFDLYDLLANTVGAGWFYARARVPALEPFVWKLAYWPSEHLWTHNDAAYGDRPASPITDYMGQTFWLSVRPGDLLPEPVRPDWPQWLAVAAGVSGDRLYTEEAQRSYYLALDVDLEHLIPARTWLAASGIELLNRLKLPAPAVRLHPRPTLFLLYFGQN